MTVERGLICGQSYFHAHEEGDDEQVQWLTQGLPWHDCQHFAQLVVAEYRRWQLNQSESLAKLLPSWLEQLKELVNQPRYLTHSSLEFWMQGISNDLEKKELSLPEVIHIFPSHNEWEDHNQFQHHTPSLMSGLKRWLTHPRASLEQRNQTWLANQANRMEILLPRMWTSTA